MKYFIKRIKRDLDNDKCYNSEPIYFKSFLYFVVLICFVGKGVFALLSFVTVPIWIIPYFIWWRNKEVGKVVKKEHYKSKKKLKEENENLKNQIELCNKNYNILSEKYDDLKGLVEDTNSEEMLNNEK